MKNLIYTIIGVMSLITLCVSTFAEDLLDETCGLPEESLSGESYAYNYPYYPTDATLKALVVFVKFTDDNYDNPPHTNLWPSTLNTLPTWAPSIISPTVEPKYSDPSISGYFDEMSMDELQITGDVYPQLYIPLNDENYYYTPTRHIGYLVEEILTQIDVNVNYANYDNLSPNGYSPDGVVDMIFICFRFWKDPVSLDIYHDRCAGICGLTGEKKEFSSGKKYLTLDGKKIYAYIPDRTNLASGTLQHNILCPHNIGLICHEYGHWLFGRVHYDKIGRWGLMDGSGPGPMCAFERAKLGWIIPTLINSNQSNVCLSDAITTGDSKKVEIFPVSTHYFLCENRQRLSYYEKDWLEYNGGPSRIKGPGLLITQIDDSIIDVECADKKWDWQKSGSNYVYPFVALNPNPFSGYDEMELRNVQTTSGRKSHPDFLGDAEDPYNLETYKMFSPWSNPNSNTSGNNYSAKAIILKNKIFNNRYADFYTTLINHTFTASEEATAFNSQRKLCRTSDGRVHMVFESEGEIFYRCTMTDGTTWETSNQLSRGNYNNKYPSIVATSTKKFVVWQRYNGSTYDIYFTKNTGSGWSTNPSTISILSGLTSSINPLPVITYKTISGGYRLLVCAKGKKGDPDGILFQYSDNEGGTWQPSSGYKVTGTTSSHKNPSLSMGPTTPNAYVYLTYDDGSTVYFNTYNTSWGSVENVSGGSACTNNKYSGVELDGYSGKNVVWQAYSTPLEANVIVHRRKTSSWSSFNIFHGDWDECYRPSVTGHALSKRSVVWYDNYNDIYKAYYNGSTWSQSVAANDGRHPNLSAGTTTAKYVWTSGSSSPYEIKLNTEALLKTTGEMDLVYHRAAVLQDTLYSSLLWIELGEMVIKTSSA